ncbi:16S rRNA (guanine(527)-N(7))-methyltransferase RsmG [Azospirillum sp. RWY-5-1]|uniref:Ribosomal RNA small subunit methyltransferase G n=1 Tax=Azospirillum oleiclasticum TaxID=2735135 RepID=A0ABX2TC05_9PROT|nr:16S rRNA (guanine(527)-N(7))-methyltransferase RsmG [Azospirillum oleiclasticum]NYZ13102.1 16S rRNA (guanine(527)-N(7))-methyltransferase RsmG [Azospirillum oleiclasticum]NYZ20225.1 16S rRNA (guanine(527)-N(7))-methyltransferase RsmG [Azospirillum oleiclasticum]
MPALRFDAAAFQAETGVSRETLDRLAAYADIVRRWQPKINLVGPSTLDDLWHRHMLDSAQLFPLLPAGTRTLVDLGSGAGFPGLVLAVMGVPDVHLVESDTRKAAFLREAARLSGTNVTVHARRIDAVPDLTADVVTARALAPLAELLAWAHRFVGSSGVALFPKGQQAEHELAEAAHGWRLSVDRFPSRTDANGAILRVSGIARA